MSKEDDKFQLGEDGEITKIHTSGKRKEKDHDHLSIGEKLEDVFSLPMDHTVRKRAERILEHANRLYPKYQQRRRMLELQKSVMTAAAVITVLIEAYKVSKGENLVSVEALLPAICCFLIWFATLDKNWRTYQQQVTDLQIDAKFIGIEVGQKQISTLIEALYDEQRRRLLDTDPSRPPVQFGAPPSKKSSSTKKTFTAYELIDAAEKYKQSGKIPRTGISTGGKARRKSRGPMEFTSTTFHMPDPKEVQRLYELEDDNPAMIRSKKFDEHAKKAENDTPAWLEASIEDDPPAWLDAPLPTKLQTHSDESAEAETIQAEDEGWWTTPIPDSDSSVLDLHNILTDDDDEDSDDSSGTGKNASQVSNS